jgi:hypothetical protein
VRDPGQWEAFMKKLVAEDNMTLDKFKEMYKSMVDETHGDEHDEYASEAIAAAKESKLFIGVGQDNFEWRDPITRQDMAVLLFRLGLVKPSV